MDAPSAQGFRSLTLSEHTSDGHAHLIVDAAWASERDDNNDRQRSRFIAFDAIDGRLLWQRDLAEECSRPQQLSRRTTVALFDNGDAAVIAPAHRGSDPAAGNYTCFARLDGVDGHIIWSRTDEADLGSASAIRMTSIAVDADGNVVAIGGRDGQLRVIKFAGADGTLMWVRENTAIPAGIAIVAASGGALFFATASAGGNSGRIDVHALTSTDGSLSWQHTVCAAADAGSQLELRAASDGSLIYAGDCGGSAGVGRLAAADGAPLWTRSVGKADVRYAFDESGDPILAGALTVDGSAVAMLRYAVADGAQRWSVAGRLGGMEPGAQDQRAQINVDAGAGFVHVWELIGNTVSVGTIAARLSRYDAATGALLARERIPYTEHDDLYWEGAVSALAGGDVVLLGSSNGCEDGCWLWMARAHGDGSLAWEARESTPSAHSLQLRREAVAFERTLRTANAGTSGLLLAGDVGVDDSYPYVAKVAADDGRVLWAWCPEPARPTAYSRIRGLETDAAGHAFIAVSARWPGDGEKPLLAKVDVADGHTLWQHYDATALPGESSPQALALDAGGSPLLLTFKRLRKFSADDGHLLWDATVADGNSIDTVRLVIDAHGDAFAAAPYNSTSGAGIEVVKFRGGDGAELWRHRWPTTQSYVNPLTLAMLSAGDVVAAIEGGGEATLVARLDAVTGAVRWSRALEAERLLVDRSGGVVLMQGHSTAHLTRLDAATGQTSWQQPAAQGPSGSDGSIASMLLDGEGHVVVSAARSGGFGLSRYSIEDGSLLWSSEPVQIGETYAFTQGPGGRLFVAAETAADPNDWTAALFAFDAPFLDRVFTDGFDARH